MVSPMGVPQAVVLAGGIKVGQPKICSSAWSHHLVVGDGAARPCHHLVCLVAYVALSALS